MEKKQSAYMTVITITDLFSTIWTCTFQCRQVIPPKAMKHLSCENRQLTKYGYRNTEIVTMTSMIEYFSEVAERKFSYKEFPIGLK